MKHNLALTTMFLMSWEKPVRKPLIEVSSFQDFLHHLNIRLDALTIVDKVRIGQADGVYKDTKENSALIALTDNASIADQLTLINVLIDYGFELRQESILLRVNNENILFDCVSGTITAAGFGIQFIEPTNESFYTMYNGIAFTLSLVPTTSITGHNATE